MKKILTLVLAVLIMAALCTACGDMREPAAPHASIAPSPEISPILSPDPEDGYVEDGDGMIGNEQGSASPAPTGSPVPSGSPAPSNPASSPKPSKRP